MKPANRARILTAYAPQRMGKRYGVKDPIYTMKGYHRGQDVRKQNADQTASVETEVVAIDGGRIVFVGGPVCNATHPRAQVGPIVVIDTGRKGDDRFESHSHTIASVKYGDIIESGDRLGRNARMNECPGLSKGIHDHITITSTADGAWKNRTDRDPKPYINAAIRRALSYQEEEMPDIIEKVVQRSKVQQIKKGVTAWLYLNDANDVSIVSGARTVTDAVLSLAASTVGGPFDVGGFVPNIQVVAQIDTVVDGKVTKTRSLGAHEVIVTAGKTVSQVPIPPHTLAAGERLRIKLTPLGIDSMTVDSASVRLASFTPGK